MDLTPNALSQADRYKLMIGSIVPRPIALVSTRSPGGASNVAPFSFFAGVGSNPMMLLFCPANTPQGQEKDSLRNAKPQSEGGRGEFAVNIVPAAIAQKMALAAEPLPYETSEFDLSGFTEAPCKVIAAPRVKESPVTFECITKQVIRTNPGAPGGGNIVIGEVVHIWMLDGLVNDRFHVDPNQLDAVGRMGGLSYCYTRDRFELPMGRG